jgi:hypothetical protein
MQNLLVGFFSCVAGLSALVGPLAAKAIKFEILQIESPAFEGRVFGSVGTFDRITARATVAVSSTDPHNAVIVDIDRAPRNAQGLVEATVDVEILRPTDAVKGNHRLIYDVVNRGTQRALAYFNDSSAENDFSKAASAGNGFLMERGYTVVISGWQGDLVPRPGWQTISVPVVPDVAGLSREEFIFDHTRNPAVATLTYPAADLDPSKTRLTVRQRETDTRETPSDLSFAFEGRNKVSINRPKGFDAGAIYELIYLAQDPRVMGMGFAATRDIVAFLRHEAQDTAGTANPLAGLINRAIGFGVSQSGRFIHDFLYLGFNEDEGGRIVFEGLMPHIGGGKKMFTNYRFAQPGRNMQEHGETLYPGTAFPFTYPVTTDPLTRHTDGWLARCLAAKNCPRIIQTDTDLEFYQSFGSLVATDTRGEPLTMPSNVRLFYLSSLQHAATAGAKSDMNPVCAYPTNPLYAGPVLRALLVAMDAWITSDTAPPPSRYPSRADGTLVTPAENAASFPKVPGFNYGGLVHQATVVDYAEMPPAKKAAYPMFVPKTDADGNAVAGVRLPTLVAPAATHLGWNVRKAGFAQGALCGNFGSMLPFAKTREERLKNNDPRLSLAERYTNPGDRAAAIEQAARQLVQDRLLLEDDVSGYLQATN